MSVPPRHSRLSPGLGLSPSLSLSQWLCLCLCLTPTSVLSGPGGRLGVLYSWVHPDFTFPSEAVRQSYLATEQYIPKNNLILDVDFWDGGRSVHDSKVFVTIPAFKPGCPATLSTVDGGARRNGTALLAPYPDWSWHAERGCDGLTSVFRTKIDECGRLWVLDSGTVDIFLDSRKIACPPKIQIFDLHSDTLIREYRFPSSQLEADSLLITIAVDSRSRDCSDSFAYIADVSGFCLLVYDFARDISWKVSNRLFYPYPLHGDFHINGVDFELMDGVFGLALGPVRKKTGDRILYFHSLASVHESWVSTAVLRNRSVFAQEPGSAPHDFHVMRETRPSQAGATDMTQDGVLVYGLVEENALACWNSRNPYRKENMDIVAKDNVNLQFQSGLKIYGNQVFVMTSRLQNYFVDDVKADELNYRVHFGYVSDLLRGSRCEAKRHTSTLDVEMPTSLVFPSRAARLLEEYEMNSQTTNDLADPALVFPAFGPTENLAPQLPERLP